MDEPYQTSLPLDGSRSPDRLEGLSLSRSLVVFDLETTGLDTERDRIVQFAFLKMTPERQKTEWMELVNPGIPIPQEASRVHHITDETVREAPPFQHFAPQIHTFLEDCDLAGFNIARFDVPFLQAELKRAQTPLNTRSFRVVDAQTIFHKKEPRDLSAAYRFYCDRDHVDAHDAMGDVRVTLEILNAQLSRYDDLPSTVSGLHTFCSHPGDRWVTPDRKFYWREGKAMLAFGKHKGKSLEWVQQNEIDYLFWLRDQNFSDETLDIIQAAIEGTFPKPDPS